MFSQPFAIQKREMVEGYLGRLVRERFAATDPKTAKLSEAVAYSLLAGGKRIRPIITLTIIELYRPLDDEAVALACTTELLHTASLMLDDLPAMDDAHLRRGRPTNHVVFGESTTILAAMALWSEAIRLLATLTQIEINGIVRETAEAVGQKGLVRGQFIDLNAAWPSHELADIEECSYLKTAILFKNAAKVGALLSDAPPGERALLEQFGKEFGLIYQIRDDLLDATEPEAVTGKDAGADEKNNRATYVTALGIEGAEGLRKEKMRGLLGELEQLPFPSVQLAELARDLEMPY